MSIHILSNPENIEKSETDEEVPEAKLPKIKINDLTAFKSTKTLYPMAKCYINVIPKGAKSKL